jgi:ATP-dependent helicase HrpA
MHFSVHDADGTVLATGDDLAEVRAAVQPQLRERLTAATSGLERHGLTAWTIGTLPREVELPGAGGAVRGFPALVDEGAAVGVAVLDRADAQAAAMHAGTRRLLALTIPSPLRALRSGLSGTAQLTLATAPHGTLDAVLEDVVTATLDVLVDEAGGPAWDEAGFARLRGAVAGSLVPRGELVLAQVVAVVAAAQDVRRAAEALTADAYLEARRDVAAQVGRLVHPGFATAAGVARLDDVERYLRGAQRRLERLPDSLAVDRDRMGAIRELEAEYRARLEAVTGPPPPALREVGWMLEELRVAQFAQAVGSRQVSAKRIRRALAEATA